MLGHKLLLLHTALPRLALARCWLSGLVRGQPLRRHHTRTSIKQDPSAA